MTDDGAAEPIEVFADVWCTFAHVGLRMVAAQRRLAGRTDIPIVVRAWPLELVNDGPMDPQKTVDHVRELQEHVAPDLFSNLDVTHFPTSTLDALALTARAYARDVDTGERAAFAVRDALFEQGRDIGDPAVIAELGEQLGIGAPGDADRAAVRRDFAEGRRRGVVGSPHFFCGGIDAFCPSLSIAHGDAGLIIHTDAQRLSAFVHQCLARP